MFESFMLARLDRTRCGRPAVVRALTLLEAGADVGTTVRETGYSHRRFLELFREGVGMEPKRYSRIRRFQRALKGLADQPDVAWADLAQIAGYSDQPHFNREFRVFAGLSPGQYRGRSMASPNHVPIPPSC